MIIQDCRRLLKISQRRLIIKPYFVYKEDGETFKVLVRQDETHIREIVGNINSGDGEYIFALMGKMSIADFQKALKEVEIFN